MDLGVKNLRPYPLLLTGFTGHTTLIEGLITITRGKMSCAVGVAGDEEDGFGSGDEFTGIFRWGKYGEDVDRRPSIVGMGCSCRCCWLRSRMESEEVTLPALEKNRRSNDTMKEATSAGEGGDTVVVACCCHPRWLAISTDLGPARRRQHAGRLGSSDQVPAGGGFEGDEGGDATVIGTVKMSSSLGRNSPEMEELVVVVILGDLDL
ncbi:hypothetical protein ACLOJK_034869 [Asimina triloba]